MNLLSHDGAHYSPAIQRSYAQFVKNGLVPLRTDPKLTGSDLHMLGGTGLFTLPNYLYAAPNALPFSHLRCMIGTRDRTVSQGIADSGGYQISTGKLNLTERKRHEILRFSETQEAALIIDAPTSAIGKRGSSFFSFRQCLEFSRDNALYAIRNREPHKTKFLIVMQGRNRREAREWRTNTMHFNDDRVFGERALDGVAFAGATRLHLSMTLEHLIVFRDSGLLRENARFHVLGTGHPKVACALTAILDGLRETLGRGVELTFDSATPFLIAGRFQRAYAAIDLSAHKMNLPIHAMPDDAEHIGSSELWSCASPIAQRLTLGDLNVRYGPRTCWDRLSYALLAAHNVWMLCHAIALVNRKLRLSEAESRLWLPEHLIDLTDKIREVLRSETPMTLIERWADDLDQLSGRARDGTLLIEDPDR